MKIVIYPGTFDPITNGHLDIIYRALTLFDKVIIGILLNTNKKPLFTTEERLEMIEKSIEGIKNIEVKTFDGLLVNFADEMKASAIIRGLRQVSDFEYEFQMALMNRKLNENISTVFLMPNEKYTYLNSSLIKELARFKADVSDFVPEIVNRKLKEKFL